MLRKLFAGRQNGSRLAPALSLGTLHIVSATRLDEKTFWRASALGLSKPRLRDDSRVAWHVAFQNQRGLPEIYNAALAASRPGDVLVCLHDDVWIDDPFFVSKVALGLAQFDVIGVAGCTRTVPRQPSWSYAAVINGEFVPLPAQAQSGTVGVGERSSAPRVYFGPLPLPCELLDGLFIAARCDKLLRHRLAFDLRFRFHHYDMDFCRTARKAGLSVGTWPIDLTHCSKGDCTSDAWRDSLAVYLGKWQS